jgi:hypothetical protein
VPDVTLHLQECPRCGGKAMRVRRLAEDRVASVANPMRRYRCTVPGCGWEDAIAIAPGRAQRRRLRARRRARAGQPRRVLAGVSVAAGLLFALIGAQAWNLYRNSESVVDRVAARQRVVPFGLSHDGEPLAPGHPLLVVASAGPAADVAPRDDASPPAVVSPAEPKSPGLTGERGAGAAATGTAPASTNSGAGPDSVPLQLRQDCAWGDPGRNPYRGTIEQALEGARLPPDVVTRLAGMIRAGEATDRLEITNDAIRAVHQYREYEPRSIAMTFGKTLCVNTRVNFKPGHMERADLYEVADASGATYSVMVPYVCGNVSVLGDRAERGDPIADAPVMVLGPDGRPVVRKSSAPLPGVIAGNIGTKTVVGAGGGPGGPATLQQAQVPVPGTLANLLGGFALLGWFLRRKRRAQP